MTMVSTTEAEVNSSIPIQKMKKAVTFNWRIITRQSHHYWNMISAVFLKGKTEYNRWSPVNCMSLVSIGFLLSALPFPSKITHSYSFLFQKWAFTVKRLKTQWNTHKSSPSARHFTLSADFTWAFDMCRAVFHGSLLSSVCQSCSTCHRRPRLQHYPRPLLCLDLVQNVFLKLNDD